MSKLAAWYMLGQRAKKRKCSVRKKPQILYSRSFSENKWHRLSKYDMLVLLFYVNAIGDVK